MNSLITPQHDQRINHQIILSVLLLSDHLHRRLQSINSHHPQPKMRLFLRYIYFLIQREQKAHISIRVLTAVSCISLLPDRPTKTHTAFAYVEANHDTVNLHSHQKHSTLFSLQSCIHFLKKGPFLLESGPTSENNLPIL